MLTHRFTVSLLEDDDQVHVVCRGDVDVAVVADLRRALESAIESAAYRVAVDLSGVGHLDSSGVKTLVRANIRARVNGKEFSLRGAQGSVRRVLDITGVDRVVAVEDA